MRNCGGWTITTCLFCSLQVVDAWDHRYDRTPSSRCLKMPSALRAGDGCDSCE